MHYNFNQYLIVSFIKVLDVCQWCVCSNESVKKLSSLTQSSNITRYMKEMWIFPECNTMLLIKCS